MTSKKDERKKKEQGSTSKKHITARKRIIVVTVLLLICTGAVVSIFLFSGSEGLKTEKKLEKKIGYSTDEAAKYAHIDKQTISAYGFVNNLTDFAYVSESDKTVDISGTDVPRWAVYYNEDAFGNLTEVSYYDFSVLKKSIYGVKKKEHIDINLISKGMKEAAADRILGMDAYSITVNNEKKIKKYKYYYYDNDSDNLCPLYLTVIYSSDGIVSSPVLEENNNLILNILKTSE